MCRVDSLCLYTKDATYQRKCFGTSRFWTSLCVLWLDSQSFVLGLRGWGHWLSAGQKMNLCFDVGFSIAPPSLTGEALSTWDTAKSLSDISSVPVISRCEGPHWPAEWKLYISTSGPRCDTAAFLHFFYTGCLRPPCLCCDGLRNKRDSNQCEGQSAHCPMKAELDTVSSAGQTVLRTNSTIIQAWPYLDWTERCVNKTYWWGEGSLHLSCLCPCTLLADSSVEDELRFSSSHKCLWVSCILWGDGLESRCKTSSDKTLLLWDGRTWQRARTERASRHKRLILNPLRGNMTEASWENFEKAGSLSFSNSNFNPELSRSPRGSPTLSPCDSSRKLPHLSPLLFRKFQINRSVALQRRFTLAHTPR